MNGKTNKQVHLQPLESRLESSNSAYLNVWNVGYLHLVCELEGV
jgi:hypothetical protein